MGHCWPAGQKYRMSKTFTEELVLSACLMLPALLFRDPAMAKKSRDRDPKKTFWVKK